MTVFFDHLGNPLSFKQAAEKLVKRIDAVLLDFELMLLRWTGLIPFHSLRLFIYRLSGMKIGRGSRIHMWVNFFDPRGINIGNDSIIGDHSFLDGRASLEIGDHVDIASQVLVYNSQHDINSEDFEAVYGKVKIDDYAFIGPRVIILPEVTVGRGAVVAAGAVVTKNVAPFSVVAGVPAAKIGERKNKNLHYRLGRARLFQ